MTKEAPLEAARKADALKALEQLFEYYSPGAAKPFPQSSYSDMPEAA